MSEIYHKILPDRGGQILAALIFGGIGLLLLPSNLSTWPGSWLRILGAAFCFLLVAHCLRMCLLRLPRVVWNAQEIIEVSGTWHRNRRFRLADHGPMMPFFHYGRSRRPVVLGLAFRPLAGGKVVMVALPHVRLSEADVAALAEEINLARGLPLGASDPDAVYEVTYAHNVMLGAFLIYLPILLVLLVWLLPGLFRS